MKIFDKIYVLNLKRRTDRLKMTEKRLNFAEIENYIVFDAVDGSVMEKIWEIYQKENSYFKNSSYLACAISHLSIYRDAIEKGYQRILILEDDNRVHRKGLSLLEKNYSDVPEDWELLYLGFIPLSDDRLRWDYNVFSKNFITENVVTAQNFWGLFSYGISQNLMKDVIETYNKEFPMELDRYFVEYIQPRKKSFGIVPQLFAADDGYSDNSMKNETGMLQRSVDTRFANLTDYI